MGLIDWSRLARWDADTLRFTPVDESEFEVLASGHTEVHREFGRLICWIVFAVGSEYLVKGLCLLNGQVPSPKDVLRPPSRGDDVDQWIQMALHRKQNSAILESVANSGDLGKANKFLHENLELPSKEKDFVYASLDLLRDSIRNRDAHRSARNERAFHFQVVHDLFVPSFNILLATLDQKELRRTLLELSENTAGDR